MTILIDFTYEDFTYNDFTYEDFTYEDFFISVFLFTFIRKVIPVISKVIYK
jgi:hypothetical protein